VTTLDMDALTTRQRDTLSRIAVGLDGGNHPAPLKVLAEKGLIVGRRELLPGMPPVEIVRWELPLDVHIQWAAWCAEQPDGEDET
jgi:hypothetical protein